MAPVAWNWQPLRLSRTRAVGPITPAPLRSLTDQPEDDFVAMGRERALVTGATGFTGRHLAERLVEDGFEVRAVVRNPSRAGHLEERGVEVVQGDLRDRDSLGAALAGVGIVYHVAALFRQASATRRDLHGTNVEGTRNLLEAAALEGVQRFVHCSTVGVHGATQNGPASEDSPFAPGDPYEESKAEAEKLVHRYSSGSRLPCVVCRPAGIYGPGDLRFLKLVRAVAKGLFVMVGSGTVRHQFVYVDDVVEGLLAGGQAQKAVGGTYILAGPAPVTLNELTETVADILGVRGPRLRVPAGPIYAAALLCEVGCRPLGLSPPLFRRRVDFFRKSRVFDISKAREELDFEPRVDVRTGMERTIAWYREDGYLGP